MSVEFSFGVHSGAVRKIVADLEKHKLGTSSSIGRRLGMRPREGIAGLLVRMKDRGLLIQRGHIQGRVGRLQNVYSLNPDPPFDLYVVSRDRIRSITFNGETMNVSQWAERFGIDQSALSHRISRLGVEKAMQMGCATP